MTPDFGNLAENGSNKKETDLKSGSSGGQTSTWDQRSSMTRQCSLSLGWQCGLRTTHTHNAPASVEPRAVTRRSP